MGPECNRNGQSCWCLCWLLLSSRLLLILTAAMCPRALSCYQPHGAYFIYIWKCYKHIFWDENWSSLSPTDLTLKSFLSTGNRVTYLTGLCGMPRGALHTRAVFILYIMCTIRTVWYSGMMPGNAWKRSSVDPTVFVCRRQDRIKLARRDRHRAICGYVLITYVCIGLKDRKIKVLNEWIVKWCAEMIRCI